MIGLRIETRQVAGIRIAIGIAAGDVEQENEVVAIGDDGHFAVSSEAVSSLWDLKKSLRWW